MSDESVVTPLTEVVCKHCDRAVPRSDVDKQGACAACIASGRNVPRPLDVDGTFRCVDCGRALLVGSRCGCLDPVVEVEPEPEPEPDPLPPPPPTCTQCNRALLTNTICPDCAAGRSAVDTPYTATNTCNVCNRALESGDVCMSCSAAVTA